MFALLSSISALAVGIADEPKTLDNVTLTQDTRVEEHHVILKSGGRARVANGAHLVISTEILEVQGPFVFDGRGSAGGTGHTPGEWKSSGPCSIGIFGPGEVAHRDWEASGGHPNDRGGDGGRGGNGATIIIEYGSLRFTGLSGRPGDHLTFLTTGGAGGAAGGGRRLVCGCHPQDVKYGPAGTPGPAGADGRYELRMRVKR
jgi:hypothetical protein